MTPALRGRQSQKEVTIAMRYDDYDEYSSRDRRDSRSRSSSSYDRSSSRSRDGYQSGYDRDRRSSSRSSYDRDRGSGYQSGGYDRGYDDRYGSRYSGSGYDRRYDQSYDRYGGRTRGGFDDFDEENWRRTAPNWVDHSDPDPAPRRRSSGSDRRRSSDYDRRDSGSSRRSSSSRRYDDRRYDDRRRSSSRSRDRDRRQTGRRSGINPLPIILLAIVAAAVALFVQSGLRLSRYGYLERERIDTGYGVHGRVLDEKQRYEPTFRLKLVLGIVLNLFAAVPVLVCALFGEGNNLLI